MDPRADPLPKPRPSGPDLPPWARETIATNPPLMNRNEAAEASRLSKKCIDRKIHDRTLTAVRAGRRVLVPTHELVAFLVGGAR